MTYFPTGNEMVSLPRLNVAAGIEDITFLHMGWRGMVELGGGGGKPLIEPFLRVDGREAPLSGLKWRRLQFWVPVFECSAAGGILRGTVLCPPGERGLGIRLEAKGITGEIELGLRGCWGSARHCVNEDKDIEGRKYIYKSAWNGAFVMDMRCGTPLFALAPICSRPCSYEFGETENGLEYSLYCTGEEAVFYWGLGFEEVAAATSAKEMLRRGWDWELKKTLDWLSERSAKLRDDKLTEIYNTNLFFCLFFSCGVTLDTEELVLVTSRSPRYYVSAAYWDRDSLLWAFPSALDSDMKLARKMLDYAFGRQARNIGEHSRYIDGTLLEPGFELDELMAPLIALESYVDAGGDRGLLEEREYRRGVQYILAKLEACYNPALGLYETFLQPTDDERVHPYLTYDNALVWRGLRALSRLWPGEYSELAGRAEAVKAAVYDRCVRSSADGRPFFAWSVDADGNFDVYDEPPGSLQLLPYYGFCSSEDETYKNTVEIIRSPGYRFSFAGHPIHEIGCPHAPHPWVLSLANSLICGRADDCAEMLWKMSMDNGIACESVHEDTGECTSGEAFATCAGFLAHAMRLALGGDVL